MLCVSTELLLMYGERMLVKRSNTFDLYVYKILSFIDFIYSLPVFSAGCRVSITSFYNTDKLFISTAVLFPSNHFICSDTSMRHNGGKQ